MRVLRSIRIVLKVQESYFLVLMDLMMPVMDGFEATTRITSTAKFEIKKPLIVALTASVTEGEIKAALQAGCYDVISKPISQEKLKYTVYNAARLFLFNSTRKFGLRLSN
jgi:CheY-like chemotaxis protein